MVFVPAEDGRWVDEKYARLAEIIQSYDSWLELRWIPPEHRTRDDKKPYMIVDTRIEKPVLYASELDTPTDILAKLIMADNNSSKVIDKLEAAQLADKVIKAKEFDEKMEEAHDYAKFLFQSPLNTVKHNGKKFDENRRPVGPSIGRRIIT